MLQLLGHLRIGQAKQLRPARARRGRRAALPVRCCFSCPNLASQTTSKPRVLPRHFSPPRTKHDISYDSILPIKASASPYIPSYLPCLLRPSPNQISSKRAYSKCCSCPGACGGCLPPPSNCAPRCLQYMTGYYYYPYGWWFCGPYHVTGTCTPVGPCAAGGPCGPCVGSPCGPCGPCAPSAPCGPPCPAPCCVCPAAAAVIASNTPLQHKVQTKSNMVPPKCPNFTPKDIPQQTRSGLAKFFPFNTTAHPGTLISQTKDMKKSPPTMPMSSLICPYSTQSPSLKEASIDESDVSYGRADYPTETRPPYTFKSVENNSFPRPPIQKVSRYAFAKSVAEYEKIRNANRSAPLHKKSYRDAVESCPTLERPRPMLSREQRDRPRILPGAFDYSSVPNYRNPYPKPHTMDFKAYES